MIDKLTATLTATRWRISPSTKIITHDHPPDRDHGGPSRTLRMDLRIRRLGVRIPPGAPASSLVKIFFSRSARVRCRWTLGAIAGAIGRQQRLGHPNSSCALLTLQRWPYCVLAEIVPDSEVLEAVEDEIEAELVLLAVVVAGAGVRAHWSVGRGAGTPSRELQQKGLRELGGLFGGAKRETPFLQCKSVDVAVEGCERVCPSPLPGQH